MYGGKKSTAERCVTAPLTSFKKRRANDPLKVFRAALDNVKPIVEVKSRRVGGASYQVPVEIRPVRRMSLAFAGSLNILSLVAERPWRKS